MIFAYTRVLFRKVSVFFYLLVLLIAFLLYYNLHYNWFGVSLIVRVYLYVFSFYLIYIYNLHGDFLIDTFRPHYWHKYGQKIGEYFLAFENRIVPFGIIFAIMVLYTLVDYITSPGWPGTAFALTFAGRYSNLIIFSLILFFALNLKKAPIVSMALFIGISLAYFFGDQMFYSHFKIGWMVSAYKIFKFVAFFFILIYNYEQSISFKKPFIVSLVFALMLYGVVISFNIIAYSCLSGRYALQRDAGLTLAKFGYSFPLRTIQRWIIEKKDADSLSSVISYGKYYHVVPDYSDYEWNAILFSKNATTANKVSSFMVPLGKNVSYDLIVEFTENLSNKEDLLTAYDFARLTAKSIVGKENDFMQKISSLDRNYLLWGIMVLKERNDIYSIPFLLKHLASVDERVSESAYEALSSITGKDPARGSEVHRNSVECFSVFNKFYQERSTH